METIDQRTYLVGQILCGLLSDNTRLSHDDDFPPYAVKLADQAIDEMNKSKPCTTL